METHYSELLLASVVLIFGVVHFFYKYAHRDRILLTDIYILMGAALIGLGPFISFSLGYRAFPEYSLPLFLTYLSFILFFVGMLISNLFFSKRVLENRSLIRSSNRSSIFFFVDHCLEIPALNIVLIFIIVIGLKVYDLSQGGGFSGFETVEIQLGKNYGAAILSHLSRPFSYILYFYSFAVLLRRQKKLIVLAIVILLFLAFEAFTSGRREMIYLICFGLFTSLAIYRKIKISHLALGGAFLLFIALVVAPFFLAIRSSGQAARGTIYGTNLSSIMDMAIDSVSAKDRAELSENMEANVAGRILLVSRVPYALFSVQNGIGDWMMGRAMFHTCTAVLPRFIRPYQSWFGTEQYIQAFYGMELRDTASSVPALFVADFGIVGAFFGGILFGIYLNGGTYIALRLWWKYPAVSMAIFGSLFFLAINTEQSPEFILNLPRNILILMFIFWGFSRLGFRLRTQQLHHDHTPNVR